MTPAKAGAALRKGGVAIAALATFAVAGIAVARTVEYLDDLAAIRAAAEDQGIPGPFSEAPGPGRSTIVLETPTAADHRVIVASIYCQAYHIENPVSTLLGKLASDANQPSAASGPAPELKLRILSGSSVVRCMGKNDVSTMCKNRVRISAEASFVRPDGTPASVPLTAQVEREGRVGGFCGNIARYTGIVAREAGIDLIRQARAAAGE